MYDGFSLINMELVYLRCDLSGEVGVFMFYNKSSVLLVVIFILNCIYVVFILGCC